MVNSGSSANLIATAAFFFKKEHPLVRDDAAIVPAVAWATTYSPLHQYGLRMKIVDVELDTLNIDPALMRTALAPDVRLIVGVSILGNPAPLSEMRALADERGMYFLEDNCESADAEIDGRKTGTFGDISTFSFFFSHHIATMEGGIALTDDEELFHLMRALRAHGWTRDLPPDSPVFASRGGDFFEAYRFILPGYNVRPMELSGAVGLKQLAKLPEMTTIRRRNLARFQECFGGDDRFIIQREKNGTSSAFSFPIILNPAKSIDRAKAFMALQDAGIGYRIITGGNVLRHDVVRHYNHEVVGTGANADIVHDYGFFVGNHPKDVRPQIDRLFAALDTACSRLSQTARDRHPPCPKPLRYS